MLERRFAVIDIETTGPSFEQGDRIIEIGVVIIENRQIVERYSTFINPKTNIPPFIQQLTGIEMSDVTVAPTFSQVAQKLYELFDNAYVVAHNVHFDLPFLEAEFKQAGYDCFFVQVIDTVELARLLLPCEHAFKLSYLAERFSLEHKNPHRAESDAEVTSELFLLLIEKLESLPIITLEKLHDLSMSFISDLAEIISSIVEEKRTMYGHETNRVELVGSMAIRPFPKVKKRSRRSLPPFSSFLDDIFSEHGGTLQKVVTNYERRDGQIAMCEFIEDAFSTNHHAVIEAGTGIGKTFAYLVAAIYQAVRSNAPVVISTQTIPLQQQLIEVDLPRLADVLPFSFTSALVKGRQHYLCLHKFNEQLRHFDEDNYEVILAKGQLLVWLMETETGDVEQLNLTGGGQQFWKEICCDESCSNRSCRFNDFCFFERSRKTAKEADLIITNHSLLFADLSYDYTLLPKYCYAIIDEAHHFAHTSSDFLGETSDYLSFSYYFNRLYEREKGQGLFIKLEQLNNNELEPILFRLQDEQKRLHEEVDNLFRAIRTYVLQKCEDESDDRGRISYMYQAHQEKEEQWYELIETMEKINRDARSFFTMMKTFERELVHHDVREELRNELTYVAKQLASEVDTLTSFLLEYDPSFVYWIEIEKRGAKNATFLFKKPIDVSEALAERFFTNKKSVILTSATLTVNDSFDYTIEQLGLTDFGPKTSLLQPAFDYKKQALVCIPNDTASIVANEQEYIYDLATKISLTSETLQGKILVLFTSFSMLKSTYEVLKPYAEEMMIPLFAQGVTAGSRAKIIKLFQQAETGILFGLNSFWEGIDLPEEQLTTLIIVRLPFPSIKQPQFAAKKQLIEEQGLNSFWHLSLPQAVLRFKQGFGRLIRTKDDRGTVIVFDKRIIEKNYGTTFLRTLPETTVKTGTFADLLEEMVAFHSSIAEGGKGS